MLCNSSFEKAYHLIWPVTYWHLLSISEEELQLPASTQCMLPELLCTQHPAHVCFQLCRAYAAHMHCTEMWRRDADVTALSASSGFDFGPL